MRFITEDTNKGDVKDPLSLNLYTYCYGNPLKYYDPSGNTGELAAGWFGSMWWLLAADGPVPIGDAIYVIGGGIIYAGEQLVMYGPQLVAMADKIKDKIGGNNSSNNDSGYNPKDPKRWNKNSTRVDSKSLYNKNGIRLDVENFNPSQRPGQIHIQVKGSDAKYYFDPVKKIFFDKDTGKIAPKFILELLKDPTFVKKLNEGLQKYLGLDKLVP